MRFTFAMILGLSLCPFWLRAQRTSRDTLPASVVQRLVDAANRRDLDGMMAEVAPEAVFSVLPSDSVLATGRDSLRAFYSKLFLNTPTDLSIKVAQRMSENGFVIDHEEFSRKGALALLGEATWVYWVSGGSIRHAWTLKAPRP